MSGQKPSKAPSPSLKHCHGRTVTPGIDTGNVKYQMAVADLEQVIGDWVKQHTLDEVLQAMGEARVPSGSALIMEAMLIEHSFHALHCHCSAAATLASPATCAPANSQ